MKENSLLASVALFSELYNSEKFKSVSDILAEFIKAAVVHEKKFTLNSTEITQLLEKVFEFKIPESVIRTTVKNKLRNSCVFNNGHYNFSSQLTNELNVEKEYNSIVLSQNKIISDLIAFIEQEEKKVLDVQSKRHAQESFSKYLLDDTFNDRFSKFISAFVIKNSAQETFTSTLNLIKEGVILYQGIKYTADLNELGQWSNDLTIFLNTEHLFNALGYNGLLFQEIFNDFYELVREINQNSKDKKPKIQLKYFEETNEEVNGLFATAELIIKGKIVLNPAKTALKKIIEDCKTPSDIKNKRVKFDLELKQKGILFQDFNYSVSALEKFNVEDQNVLEFLRNQNFANKRDFDENECIHYFRLFTKVNCFRKGQSSTSFEKVGYILLTENSFAKYIAHANKVKFDESDIAFAKDIDFMTTKFWFKLKKGFSNKQNLPKSFDIVTKARLVLSAQLNNSISQEYKKLLAQHKAGTLTKEEAIQRSYELRNKPNKPEEITVDNVENSLDFLNDNSYFENIFREREKQEATFRETQRKNLELEKEIAKRDKLEKDKESKELLKKYIVDKQNYVLKNWQDEVKKYKGEARYFIGVIAMTVLPIIIMVLLKFVPAFNSYMSSLGNFQYVIFGLLVIICLIELIGRSYLFDKDKCKQGWRWIKASSSRKLRAEIHDKKINLFENDFLAQFPEPENGSQNIVATGLNSKNQ